MVMKNVVKKKSKDSLPVPAYAVQLSDDVSTKRNDGERNCLRQ